MSLQIDANRAERKWTRQELAGRVLWALCGPLFRWSPRVCWGWRRWLLRRFGAQVGNHVQIHPSVRIFIPWNLHVGDWSSVGFDVLLYNLGPLQIGREVTISQRAHLCGGSHDHADPEMRLEKCPVTIEDSAWICADAFVGPGVIVGTGAVVGARAVVIRSVVAWTIVVGNPARIVGHRTLEQTDPSVSEDGSAIDLLSSAAKGGDKSTGVSGRQADTESSQLGLDGESTPYPTREPRQ